jgi:hypothetical protein
MDRYPRRVDAERAETPATVRSTPRAVRGAGADRTVETDE